MARFRARPRPSRPAVSLALGSLIALLMLGAGSARPPAAAAAPTLPAGFSDALVAAVGGPTALAFTPDGRLLITTQGGRLRLFAGGALMTALDLSARICANSERGLLGVAVDPRFADPGNGRIYLYYTYNASGECPTGQPMNPRNPVNRVSRFTMNGNTVDPASETVLLDNIFSPNGNHNGGDLQFGKDGYLYVSVGDGACDYAGNSGCAGANDAARDGFILNGKILRIAADGGIPATNPFVGGDSARCNLAGRADPGKICRETFARGLRNPFRMAFDPNAAGTRFFINDVGQDIWEEIDEGQAGADYGWNLREGHCANTGDPNNCGGPKPAGLTDPIYDYRHTTGCTSITGGAFVPNGLWPGFDGAYLFSDYVCGKIFARAAGGGVSDFVTGLGSSSAVDLRFGPYCGTQALYYTTYQGGGQVRRINRPAAANCAPTAAVTATPAFGDAPLAVSFDGSGSGDPNGGDALTYLWDFGDGATTTTTTPTVGHTYTSSVLRSATLRVRDNAGADSAPATVQIGVGNTPPTPTIAAPAADARFRVGQDLVLRGSATDRQEGALDPSRLSWTVILHHNTHTHPFLGPTTGTDIPFTAPAPEDLAAAETSFLEIRLTATDAQGLGATVVQELRPALAPVSLATEPPGFALTVNGVALATPRTLTSWEGYALTVAAPGPGGAAFAGWTVNGADAGSANPLAVTTPAGGAAIVARFGASPVTATTGLHYYPLPAPVRLLDTRAGFAACDPRKGPLATGDARAQGLFAGCTGIPAGAAALVGNATAVNSGGAQGGYATLYPGGSRPEVSNLNYAPGQTIANAFTVGLGGDAFTIYTSQGVDFLIDVTGYYAPPGAGGLYFHRLDRPVRLLDTRAGFAACDTAPRGPLPAGATRAQGLLSGCTGVPGEAAALAGNATVVDDTGAPGGFLTLWPGGRAQPNVSNVNYAPGQTIANAFTVGLGGGAFHLAAYSGVDVVIDITGYYSAQPSDANGPGLSFTLLSRPLRLLDTRAGFAACIAPGVPLAAGTPLVVPGRRPCSGYTPPAAARALVGNATVVNAGGGAGFLTVWPNGAALPNASNVNYTPGQIVANAAIVGLGDDGAFALQSYTGGVHVIVDYAGYFAP